MHKSHYLPPTVGASHPDPHRPEGHIRYLATKENLMARDVNKKETTPKDWRQVLRRLDDVRWELPMTFMEGMRVPGLIFADDALMDTMANDEAVAQVANVAT